MNRVVKAISILLVLIFLVAVAANKQFGIQNSKLNTGTNELVIFHAGSLAVPFKQICEEFNAFYPEVKIVREAAGSRICARKITELNRPCDVIALADYTVIDALLIPEYAKWNIRFAGNEMVVAFRRESRRAKHINRDNWCDILLENDVAFGRSDPNADPCGYRAVLTIILAEKFYNRRGLARSILAKDRKYIRPKEVGLLALLEVGELDYIFVYRSVAEQHKLQTVLLPDQINLKKAEFADFYRSASVCLTGKRPGSFITKVGEPIVYGVTIPKNAPNPELALKFLTFLLDADKGGAILERNGQTLMVPSTTDTFDRLPECLTKYALPVQQGGKG